MKYENYDKVQDIMNSIYKLENNLSDLNRENLVCSIKKYGTDKEIFMITTYKEEADINASYLVNIIEHIKSNLKKQIDVLRKQLEKL